MTSFPFLLSTLLLMQPAQVAASPITLSPAEWQKRLQEADDDVVYLLKLFPLAPDSEREQLLKKTNATLEKFATALPQARLASLEAEVAELLPKVLSRQQHVKNVLGSPERVNRQILYNRYREQWTYTYPLAVVLTFECYRGQEPKLLDAYTRRPMLP